MPRISVLTPVTSLAGTEEVALVQGGTTKRAAINLFPTSSTLPINTYLTTLALIAATVDASVSIVTVQGYNIAGDGGEASYRRADPQPAHSMWVQSADGAYWVPLPDQSGAISVEVAGAVGDGVTDDWLAIQTLVDAHTYYDICSYVSFSKGRDYLISNTVQCGYGGGSTAPATFVTTHLRGSGGALETGDAVLVCDFSDRPGVNAQGQRFFSMFGLSVRGLLEAWIDDHSLGTNDADLDDSDRANWIDPSLAPDGFSRTAPYAGIAIDGLSGDSPTTPYPSLPAPAFVGVIGDYNRAFSSKMCIEQGSISGFDVGYVVHPGDGAGVDGNGDFHDLLNCQIVKCRYAISIGHTQCRQVNRIGCEFSRLFCMETTERHGNRDGKMEGISLGCAVDTTINLFLFDNDLSKAGPIKYEKLYGELIWSLGSIRNSTAVATSIEFSHCNIVFDLQQEDEIRGVPAHMLNNFGPAACNIIFNGGAFTGYWSVMHMYVGGEGNNLTINGTLFLPRNFGSKQFRWERAGQNVTASIPLLPVPEVKTGVIRIDAPIYNLSDPDDASYGDSLPIPTMIGPTAQNVTRNRPCCALVKSAWGRDSYQEAEALIPKLYNSISKVLGTTLLVLEMTFTYTDSIYNSMRYGPRQGDVIMDTDSGSVFYVNDLTAVPNGPDFDFTVHATLQNNFKPDGIGGFVPINSIDLTSGTWWILNARVYRPPTNLIGDMTSASANVTNAGSPDGNIGADSTGVVNGDWYLVTEGAATFPFPATDNVVSALAATGFTLGANARYTEVRHPFQFFIRAASG